MLKIIRLISILGVIFIFIGCNKKSSTNEKNITKLVKIDKNDKNRTIEETFLNEMGFEYKNQKIVIDLNKTTNFFSRIEDTMKNRFKDIKNKIKKSDINITKNSGVNISKKKIDIDLNKTENTIENISKLFKNIILDINRSLF